jgi:outer membrane murein-binding lipoprotein Lpp
MEDDCEKRINVIRKEMADKNTEGFKEMEQIQKKIQQESDAQIAELKQEIENLRRQTDEAQREQERANNELRDLHTKQEGLLQKLGTVNEMLANQLRMINDNIDISNPEYGDYKDLLDTIESGLSGVITGINSAVSGTIGSSSSGPPPPRPPSSGPPSSGPPYDAEKNYTELVDWFKKYGRNDFKLFFTYIKNYGQIKGYTIPDNEYTVLSEVAIPAKKTEIIKILKKYSMIIAELPRRGGKRKRKTMKKRPRKSRNLGTRNLGTRKHMKKYQKGGYTYNKNDKLDKASSDVSNSLNSFSKSNSNTRQKSRRRPRSRTKRRSRK